MCLSTVRPFVDICVIDGLRSTIDYSSSEIVIIVNCTFVFTFFQEKQYTSLYIDNSSSYNVLVLPGSQFYGLLLGV